MLFIQKTARLLIRPLCLIQPGCGFTARCRLAHFAYHMRDFQRILSVHTIIATHMSMGTVKRFTY